MTTLIVIAFLGLQLVVAVLLKWSLGRDTTRRVAAWMQDEGIRTVRAALSELGNRVAGCENEIKTLYGITDDVVAQAKRELTAESLKTQPAPPDVRQGG